MRLPSLVLPTETWPSERARALAQEQRELQYRRTDQLFVRLLACEYAAGIAAAAWISPSAWSGNEWAIHPHVWSATLLGGLIVSLPIALAWMRPGKSLTRQVIGIAQMLMSGLLIHLTQGRIETHFHVFGSLAFLAFYRDWRVLITASAVTALDHLIRGYAWPLSIYGVELYSPWRWLEHTAWVIFEDIFLILACLQSNRETKAIAERQYELENTHHELEIRVKERTADLECANEVLQAEVCERVRAEAALRLSEFSVANASLPTFWIASDAHILRVNRAVSELLGYSEAELLELSITDLDPDFNTDRWPSHWEELRQKKRMSFETRQRHKSGHIIPIEVDLNWFEFEGVEYNFAFIRDITERKRDKEMLAQRAAALESQRLAALDLAREAEDARHRAQRSEDRLNLALKSSGVGTWSWNIVENSIFWDQYLHPLFGLEPGTFGGTFEAFTALVAPEERERVQREVTQSVEYYAEYDTEFRVVWPDQSFHVLAARGKVYRDAAGQALNMTGVCWDVTERHLVERSLHESQERFALAVEGSRDGIWDWNVSTNQVFYSTRWKSMLGYKDHEIANQYSEWERLVHPEDLPHAKQVLNEYFADERPEYTVEFRMLHQSGDWRWILARGVARRDATGTIVRMSGSHTDITERKVAEQSLATVNAQLAGVLAASTQVSIIATDAQGLITVFNTGAENLLGYSAAEMIGQQTPKGFHVPEEVLARGAELTRELGYSVEGFEVFVAEAKRGRFDQREWTYVRKDGGRFAVSLVVTAVKNSEGEITGFLGVAQDITERKRAEERFRLVVEAAPSAIVVIDRERRITLVNSRTEALFGYLRNELIGQRIEILVPERFRSKHPDYVEGFFREYVVRELGPGRNLFGVRKSGEEVPIELGLCPLTTTEGKFVLASIIDISERKLAEEELHRAKESAEAANRVLDSSLKSIADGVIVADSTGKFLFWNEEAEEIIGVGSTDTPIEGWSSRYGCFLSDMVTPCPSEDLPLVRTIRGEEVHEVDLFIRNSNKPDGVWISVNGRPMRDDANEVQGGVIVFRDMTERRQAQETLARQAQELARSNTELQQFAYIASHDLQEPLRKVQSFGDMLAKDAGPALSVDGHDYLKRMQNAAARMQHLINDLLSYSRVATQAQPFETVDLTLIASEVLSDLESRIASTGGQVHVGELPCLDADPLQMRQLLQNLIGNALKFHRPNVPPVVSVLSRRIRLETVAGAERPTQEITVQDNGIGFDEKYLVKLFAPFQRLHGRGEYEGTGIGLAICKKIVDRHGGTITARSVPGEGSRFIVTLPLVQDTGVPPHASGDTHHAQTR
jgi:PAS domain S-box-containing protein